MAGNGGGDGAGSGRGGAGAGASISTAAAAIGSVESRFPLPEQPRQRWEGRGGCLGGLGLSCFRSQRKAKRIVPSSTSRIPDRTTFTAAAAPPSTIQHNGVAITTPSLLAPPSSPASFTHSAVPSTAQSPSCFLSPGGASTPATTMFTTGPYAHETQLVSPPVFSTFTTEPSTPTLTPPHLTNPPSPEVPFAHLLDKATQDYEFPSGSLISSAASSPFHHRVSFDLTVEEVTRCLAKESDVSKDFNFGEATAGPETQPANWAFFPMIQSGAI